MRYAGLLTNDFINGEGVCVSYWAQGCPHKCPGCHNPSTWDFNDGQEVDEDELIETILRALNANGVRRNLSILGGEPLAANNINFTNHLAMEAKRNNPDITVYLWTGYQLREIEPYITTAIDVVIDGPFVQAKRNVALPLRGSTNQIVWRRDKNGVFQNTTE